MGFLQAVATILVRRNMMLPGKQLLLLYLERQLQGGGNIS
jgi:hypothetical protein